MLPYPKRCDHPASKQAKFELKKEDKDGKIVVLWIITRCTECGAELRRERRG